MSYRTHYIEELDETLLGKEVTLAGWIQNYRKLGAIEFFDLRDRTGMIQLSAKDSSLVPDARNEYVVSVKGVLCKKEVANPKLSKGAYEIDIEEMTVLNEAEATPFPVKDDTEALEDTRLKYRYLDLRRPSLVSYLSIKAKIMQITHEYFDSHHFLEVETPILNLATPEGARDYLVPSRLHHGFFYALPQSPQLFKQLLMIGGIDRYYQIARCFRDEDLRSDRQPEFTQIDVEASFMSQEEILTLAEGLFAEYFRKILGKELSLPLRRIPYWEAMDTYGSDKPDTRYALHLIDLSFLSSLSIPLFEGKSFIRALFLPKEIGTLSRKKLDALSLEAKKLRVAPLLSLKVENAQLEGSFTKFLDEASQKKILSLIKGEGTLLFGASASRRDADFALGAVRTALSKEFGLIKEGTYDLLWVTDFPMFTRGEDGSITAEHHPFTRPRDEDLKYLKEEPEKVLAYAYDIIFNGYEAGGGTLRIYDRKMQAEIFTLLGLSKEEANAKFGWFLDAFRYGAPPHGGFALGLDRLAMIFGGTDNIRDVIAFPKNLQAVDPMSNAPGKASKEALDTLGISIKKEGEEK